MKKTLTALFTPFYSASSKVYLIAATFWVIVMTAVFYNAPALLPTPTAIFNRLVEYMSDTSFYFDIFASLELTIKSMLISIVFASIFAYLSTITFFKPIISVIVKLRFMSLLGFLFVFMSILHDANRVKESLLIFSTVPFFTLSLTSTITRIQQREYDLWTTLRYNKWEQLFEVIIRGKLDYVLEAIGVNFAMAWIMMTLAESKSMADGGLGVLLFKADKYNQLDRVFALQIIIFTFGIIFDYMIKKLRYQLFPYTALAEKK